jgi:molybdopterin converting factor small subunit
MTITVNVRTIALLKALLGQGEVRLSLPAGSNIADLLALMLKTWGDRLAPYFRVPELGVAHPPIRVMVNGHDIAALRGRETELHDGDDVLMLTPMAGG